MTKKDQISAQNNKNIYFYYSAEANKVRKWCIGLIGNFYFANFVFFLMQEKIFDELNIPEKNL